MRGSLKLGTFLGIGVFIHWTFWLLIGWITISALSSGQGLLSAALNVAFIFSLFGCVVLHEFGHALAARRYGIPTRDITLLPIGGVARLARIPEKPWQEFVVAIAGPAVNVVMVGILFILLSLTGGSIKPFDGVLTGGFLANLMWVNVALVVFNMLPAFPMDGGRVLRAALGALMTHEKATRIAATVGQTLAVGFAVLGLFGNPMLLLIAAFVFFGATGEAQMARVRSRVTHLLARDAMITQFRTLPAYLSVSGAAQTSLGTPQRDFPVDQNGKLVGMLRRGDLLAALEAGHGQAPIIETMRTDFVTVEADMPLFDALQTAGEAASDIVAVVDKTRLVGLLDTAAAIEVATARSRLVEREKSPITAEVVNPPMDIASPRL